MKSVKRKKKDVNCSQRKVITELKFKEEYDGLELDETLSTKEKEEALQPLLLKVRGIGDQVRTLVMQLDSFPTIPELPIAA